MPKDLSADGRRTFADGAAFIAIKAAVRSDNFDNPVAVTGHSFRLSAQHVLFI